jgi:hypothetical protein
MSEPKSSNDDDYSSTNLSVMAAAAEHRISTAAAAVAPPADDDSSSDVCSSPCRRSKLVLPSITPAMEEDLALTKLLGTDKSPKPISFGGRPEFADYPLKGIMAPHPNDVCKWMSHSKSRRLMSFVSLTGDLQICFSISLPL